MNRALWAVLLVVLVLLPACGSDDDPVDPGPDPTPDFTMQVSPTSITVEAEAPAGAAAVSARGTADLTVTVSRSGGFEGAVTVTVEGLPTGVTAGALTIGGGETSGAVTLTAGSSAAAGTATLTVRGSGSGVTARTASVTLAVTVPEPPAPSETFQIALASTGLSLQQGASSTVGLTIDRSGGYTGEVSLTATSDPAGPGLAFDPAATTDDASTLTVTVASDLTPGEYAVTVTGTGGDHEAMATLTVTVTQATGGAGNTTLQFCEDDVPVWVAVQDGTGDWMQVVETDGVPGEFRFEIASGKGAVAIVDLDDGDATLAMFYGSQEQLDLYGGNYCETPGPTKTLTGAFANVGATEAGQASMGGASSGFVLGASGNLGFTLQNVQPGPTDLLASRLALQGQDIVPNRGIIRRGVDYPDGSVIPTLDFAAEGFDPVQRSVTLTNTMGHQTLIGSSYTTSSAFSTVFFTPAPGSTYFGVPESAQEDGDLHVITATAVDDANATDPNIRSVTRYQKVAADVTLALGPLLSTPTVTAAATTPYLMPQTRLTVQSEYDDSWQIGYSQGGGNSVFVLIFSGYEPGGTIDHRVPDFSPTSGWENNWGLDDAETTVFISANGWTGQGGIPGLPPQLEGGMSMTATSTLTFN